MHTHADPQIEFFLIYNCTSFVIVVVVVIVLFDSTPVGVNLISSRPPHVRPMGVHRTCGEPDEIKKNTPPKNIIVV